MPRQPDQATSWKLQEIPYECRKDEYDEVAWGITKYAGQNPKHVPMWIPRPKVTEFTVKYDIVYSGICHSDCHVGTNDWFSCVYPCVLGHEHAGIVTEVGSKVTKVKVGDRVGVGCFIDSCLSCKMCEKGEENYCEKGMTETFNGQKTHGRVAGNQELTTFGGYSASNVVHEYFVMKIPDSIPLEKAPPLFCAAITLYDPLRHWGATKKDGDKMVIGVVGVGGLGTMGIKLAKALGHTVVAVSRSKDKEVMAKEKGADYYIDSSDSAVINEFRPKCDLILSTVGVQHDLNVYMPLLAQDGSLVLLGGNTHPQRIHQMDLMMKRQKIAGSLIGGIKATEECLDLCAKHGIYPDIEQIEAKDIDWAWKQLIGASGNKDGVRYVIDVKKSLENKDFLPKSKEIAGSRIRVEKPVGAQHSKAVNSVSLPSSQKIVGGKMKVEKSLDVEHCKAVDGTLLTEKKKILIIKQADVESGFLNHKRTCSGGNCGGCDMSIEERTVFKTGSKPETTTNNMSVQEKEQFEKCWIEKWNIGRRQLISKALENIPPIEEMKNSELEIKTSEEQNAFNK